VALQQPPAGLWAKFAGSAVVGDRLHLFGDFGHHVFDAATGQWQTRAPLPFALVMPAVVARGGSIWIVGGERLDNTPIGIVEYEIAADRWLVHAAAEWEGRRGR
jgi:N-acetylneuraminic acid mutarotase